MQLERNSKKQNTYLLKMESKMIIGNKNFEKRTHIMGILNVTPDSFSDGGKYNNTDNAIRYAHHMITDGADIIDIGGESTRPGYTQISDEEEIERVCTVIEKIKNNFDIPVSIDTYKPYVAQQAIKSGADLINDIWGLKYDYKMADMAAKYKKPVCIMHNRKNPVYKDFINDVISDLDESIRLALNAGLTKDMIMVDPGVGFAKSYEQNIIITNNLEKLHALDVPLLLGTSRKSMIGITLDLPVEERLEGTLATTVFAVLKDCLFVRVHDIKENKRIITMSEKLLRKI